MVWRESRERSRANDYFDGVVTKLNSVRVNWSFSGTDSARGLI